MNRRDFLKVIGIGATIPHLGMAAMAQENSKSAMSKPNIFFAIADDWAWPHSGSYGDKVINTPTFDRIATNGILFNNAFVTAPSCTPSRNSILTGQHHWRLGSGANLWSKFPEGQKTFPNMLEDSGYFVGSYRKAFGPGQDSERPSAGKAYRSVQSFFDARPKDKPFCFWFGSSDPHRPYEWQSGIDRGMKIENVRVPPYLPDNTEVRTDICDYYWEAQRFDREVGQALAIIEETGEMDNTIVVITGDNGWPFPRAKSNLYDAGVHVPLAIQWLDKISKGRVVDDFVSFVDFAPTFLEAAQLSLLDVMTGQSLMNVLQSEKVGVVDASRDHVLTGKERHTPAQANDMLGTPMRAIRNKDFLYIRNFASDRWPAGDPTTSMLGPALSDIDGSPTKTYIVEHKDDPVLGKYYQMACGKRPADELYDLKKDPHQIDNVAGNPAYASILKELKEQLMAELTVQKDPRVLGQGDIFDTYRYYGSMREQPQT